MTDSGQSRPAKTPEQLRGVAATARRLARGVTAQRDVETLEATAEEMEREAARLEAEAKHAGRPSATCSS